MDTLAIKPDESQESHILLSKTKSCVVHLYMIVLTVSVSTELSKMISRPEIFSAVIRVRSHS